MALTADQAQRLSRAFRALQQGDLSAARGVAQDVAQEAPRSADAYHLLALCCKRAGQRQEADTCFRRALTFAPQNAELLANYGNFLRELGRLDESLALLRRAVAAAPRSMQGWLNLGNTALAVRRPAEAIRALEHAVGLDPAAAAAWNALGRARRASGDLPGAEQAFRKAVAVAPANGAAWVNLGVVVRLLGRPAESLSLLENARRAEFRGPEAVDARGAALIDLGRIEEALDLVRHLTANTPEYTPGHVTLAHLLWEHGAELAPDEDPVAAFRQAADNQAANAPLQLAYVRFLMEAGRAEEALGRLRNLRAVGDAPPLAILEASALDALGEARDAGLLYEQVHARMGVRDAPFLSAWSRHLIIAREWDAAAVRAAEATRADPDNQEAWGYLATAWRLTDDPREHWLCDYDRSIALVEVDPPPAYSRPDDFLEALRSALDLLHKARREPVNQSLRGGSQTAGRLFGRPVPVIAEAEAAITSAVERHIASLPDDAAHPFYRRKARSVSYIGSWSVKLRSLGRHINHFHPQGWMSSAYYVSIPPSVASASTGRDRAGWIQFGQPPDDLELTLEPRRYVQPRPGWVALFPSYMWHGTVPFEDPEPRITVAFDMIPAS